MTFGEDHAYIAACTNGACAVVAFWINPTRGVHCPYCEEIGVTNVRVAITSAGRPEQASTGEDPVGRSGQREIESGSGVLHEGVGGRERVRDHDGQEKGQPGLAEGVCQLGCGVGEPCVYSFYGGRPDCRLVE